MIWWDEKHKNWWLSAYKWDLSDRLRWRHVDINWFVAASLVKANAGDSLASCMISVSFTVYSENSHIHLYTLVVAKIRIARFEGIFLTSLVKYNWRWWDETVFLSEGRSRTKDT